MPNHHENLKPWEKGFLEHTKDDWEQTCEWVKTLEDANAFLEQCLEKLYELTDRIKEKKDAS